MKLNALQTNPALLSKASTQPEAGAAVTKNMSMEKIEETARDFEAMFLSEMFKPIFDSVGVDETFGGGKTEEIFGGFLRDEYSKLMAGTGNIGIAQMVKDQLIEMQTKAEKQNVAQNVQGKTT